MCDVRRDLQVPAFWPTIYAKGTKGMSVGDIVEGCSNGMHRQISLKI